MSIAPEGREASFAALSAAPLFAAKIPVGLLSGYLIQTYLPEDGVKDGQTMWLIIGLLTLSSPICVTLLEPWIREPETQEKFILLSDQNDNDKKYNKSFSILTSDNDDVDDNVEIVL
jgi:hypothetical protein